MISQYLLQVKRMISALFIKREHFPVSADEKVVFDMTELEYS